jgi:hypothetical protein
MNEHARTGGEATGTIFAWRGDEVVLFGERNGDAWILARGWSFGDRLIDVRRWTFDTAAGLARQVRRLAREATGNQAIAADAAASALAWADREGARG